MLERVTIEAAEAVAEAARAARDPVAALRAGSTAWLRIALEPAIQRIVLTDAPVVVGWKRWRELDEQHTLGGLRANLRRIAESGRLPGPDVDPLAHMLLAAVNEAALLVARAPDPEIAFRSAQAAVETLIDRLVLGLRARPRRRPPGSHRRSGSPIPWRVFPSTGGIARCEPPSRFARRTRSRRTRRP